MSSRIRIFATHPQFGVFSGPQAKHQIAFSAGMFWQADHHKDKSTNHRAKRIGEQLGWTVKLFRVPKGVKLAKTEWGRFLAQRGLFPYKERKGNKSPAGQRGRLPSPEERFPEVHVGPPPIQAGDDFWQNVGDQVGGIEYQIAFQNAVQAQLNQRHDDLLRAMVGPFAGMGVAQAPQPQPEPRFNHEAGEWELVDPPDEPPVRMREDWDVNEDGNPI